MTRERSREIVRTFYPELAFEISESEYDLKEIIEAVQMQYPGWRFNRTEARYQSCVVAIFETDL